MSKSGITIIRGSRDVDMKYHTSNHKLTTPVMHSLVRRDDTFLDGCKCKLELASHNVG